MVQILKDNQRKKIIEAAKIEFLSVGVKDANMRSIAYKSNMTVGNLYRYYSSKEELVNAIFMPVYNDLNNIIKRYTNDQISFYNQVSAYDINLEDVKSILDSLSSDLIMLYKTNATEIKIILKENTLNKNIKLWFSNLIKLIAFKWSKVDINDLYCEMLAHSIFEGLKYAFNNAKNEDELSNVIKFHLNNFIIQLSNLKENINE